MNLPHHLHLLEHQQHLLLWTEGRWAFPTAPHPPPLPTFLPRYIKDRLCYWPVILGVLTPLVAGPCFGSRGHQESWSESMTRWVPWFFKLLLTTLDIRILGLSPRTCGVCFILSFKKWIECRQESNSRCIQMAVWSWASHYFSVPQGLPREHNTFQGACKGPEKIWEWLVPGAWSQINWVQTPLLPFTALDKWFVSVLGFVHV